MPHLSGVLDTSEAVLFGAGKRSLPQFVLIAKADWPQGASDSQRCNLRLHSPHMRASLYAVKYLKQQYQKEILDSSRILPGVKLVADAAPLLYAVLFCCSCTTAAL